MNVCVARNLSSLCAEQPCFPNEVCYNRSWEVSEFPKTVIDGFISWKLIVPYLEDSLWHWNTEKEEVSSSVRENLFLMIFLLVSVPTEICSWPDLKIKEVLTRWEKIFIDMEYQLWTIVWYSNPDRRIISPLANGEARSTINY